MRALRKTGDWQAYLTAFDQADDLGKKTLGRVLGGIHEPALIDALISRLEKPELTTPARLIVLNTLARLSHVEDKWGEKKSFWSKCPDDRGPYYAPVEWPPSDKIKASIEKNSSLLSADQHSITIDVLILNRLDPTALNLTGLDPLAMSSKKLDLTFIDILAKAANNKQLEWTTRAQAAEKIFNNPPIEELVQHQEFTLANVLGAWIDEGTADQKALGLIHDYWTTRVKVEGKNTRLYKAMHHAAAKGAPSASMLTWKKILFNEYMPVGAKAEPFTKRFVYGKENAIRKEEWHPKQIGYFRAVEELGFLSPALHEAVAAGVGWDSEAVNNAAKKAQDTLKTHEAHRAGDAKTVLTAGNDGATEHALAYAGKGDLRLGAKLFNTTGCIICHNINTQAQAKGPYLGAAGAQFERAFLIESILNPYAAKAQGFPTYQYTLKNGKGVKMGFQTYEDEQIYRIMNATGVEEEFKKAVVEKKGQLQVSQMPPGLVNALSLHEFNSLIDYLDSLKGE